MLMARLHSPNPCKSCPFRKEREGYFNPEILKSTVGKNLEDGFIHECHSLAPKKETQWLCTGFLSYLEHHTEGGLDSNTIARVGICLGVIDKDAIAEPDIIFDSFETMLAAHEKDLKLHQLMARITGKDKT